MRRLLAALMLTLPNVGAAQETCGAEDAACALDGGTYRIEMPENAEGRPPAVLFLHGFGGSADGTMRQGGMVNGLVDRGYAVIAPNGQAREGGGGLRWDFRPEEGRGSRDDDAFLIAVVEDAVDRHGIDGDRVILGGFSNGAFLVYYLACRSPEAFAAYAPVSGGFWRPHPEDCAGPVRLFHTHGWSDSTVPLEGRPLRGGQWVQGDIFEGLTIWRAANGCDWADPDAYSETGQFMRRRWECGPGSALELALFPGGHGVPDGWADMMLDWFEALPETES